MDKLTELAIKYGTDKWGKHHYTPVYFDLFKDRRDEVKKVLEIGIAEGAGLRMFRDFFPNATIFGAELEMKRLIYGEKRIKTLICDQSLEMELLTLPFRIGSDLDLVIDDGSHVPSDQVLGVLTLMPKLDKNVVYVVEDVADYHVYDKLRREEWLDVHTTKLSNRYDDRLVIVRHKNG